jgi:hypothetical protein
MWQRLNKNFRQSQYLAFKNICNGLRVRLLQL